MNYMWSICGVMRMDQVRNEEVKQLPEQHSILLEEPKITLPTTAFEAAEDQKTTIACVFLEEKLTCQRVFHSCMWRSCWLTSANERWLSGWW